MKTGLKSLWFTMVHCCRRKFVGLCRINHFCVNRQWGRFRRTKHDQTGDWLDSTFMYFCWMPAETAMTSVCLCLSSFRTRSQRWSPNTRSRRTLSLSFKKDKLWTPCFSFAERIAWQVVDYFGVEINWLQPVHRWRIERGPPNPRTRHAKMWPRETSWKWWNVEHGNDSKGYLFFGNVALLSLPFMSESGIRSWILRFDGLSNFNWDGGSLLRLAGGSGKHGRQGRGGFLKFWNSTEQFAHFKEQTEHEDWFEKPLVHYGSLLPQKVCRIMSD